MADWGQIKTVPIGGLLAVGFLDERRVLVGSHSGLGVFDAATGAALDRVVDPDGDYSWFHDSPPRAIYVTDGERHSIQVAGLWGGSLPSTTDDGWACRVDDVGAALSGPDGSLIAIADAEVPRACGFSPHGHVFVFATSPTLHLAIRSSP